MGSFLQDSAAWTRVWTWPVPCVWCVKECLGRTLAPGAFRHKLCKQQGGALLFLGISVQPCGDWHSRAGSVPGVAFLPPPSLGNLTRGLFVPVFPQSTHR